jgi:hypothetical protein
LADIDPHETRRSREQSSISFPYVDLYAAAEVAQAIQERSGSDSCNLNDLAADFGDGNSGAFRLKTSAARIFDLVEKRGRSELRLTESGRQILSNQDTKPARAQAFLRVPLYQALYRKYKDAKLPQRRDLEEEMKALGVPAKQVDKARQVFERSARQAGFFDESDNRLVHPGHTKPQIGNTSAVAANVMMDIDDRLEAFPVDAAMLGRFRREDPLIVGLIERLPTAGAAWSDEARVAWLRLANSIFNVAYTDGGGDIRIDVAGAAIEGQDEADTVEN